MHHDYQERLTYAQSASNAHWRRLPPVRPQRPVHVLMLQSIPFCRCLINPPAGSEVNSVTKRKLGLVRSKDIEDEAPPQDDPLAELRWHWGSAYNIDCCKGTWTATCKGDTYVMSATSPDDLRSRIWDDYSRRKIPGAIGDA